ncbi:MAG: bifunctional UDP-N-acetylmuramoyl-tripeptide:D-alanyl-D-alanine ligase/alanine racemase [Bacteroidota bacterium]
MPYSIDQISNIIGSTSKPGSEGSKVIHQLLIDSRQLTAADQTLFFALQGQQSDGHRYIPELYKAGVRCFVIRRGERIEACPQACFLEVESPQEALQQLAAYHRAQFELPVIGITGSNGKTIVKEWLHQLLHDRYRIIRSPRSYNSQIGVPLSVWPLDASHELALFEAGISQPGEMEKIAAIIQPSIALLTHIGPAHDEGFEDRAQKIAEKLRLFESAQYIHYCLDKEEVARAAQAFDNKQHFRWSRQHPEAELYILDCQAEEKQTRIRARYQREDMEIAIPFRDAASIENAIHCWGILLQLGLPKEYIQGQMSRLEAVAMRLELIEGAQQCTLINDSYNFDLHALQIALSFLDQQSYHPSRSLILSDLLQSGLSQDQLYKRLAQLISDHNIDRLIGIGQAIPIIASHLPSSIAAHFYADTDEFLAHIHELSFFNEAILLKGARPFEFERIARRLSRRVHKTVLEIDLNALVHNLHLYRQRLAPNTRLMAMVKASAYGSGSSEVAKLLASRQVDYLAVAYVDEGVELRKAGVQLPILVLNPEENSFEAILQYQLEAEIYSLELLRRFSKRLTKGQQTNVHLKIDTGMHRLGFERANVPALIQLLQAHPQLQVRSIFSHLAASETAEHDEFTTRQIQIYEGLYEDICRGIGYRPLRHILNSGGIVRFPQYQMDMVRLGIGLYGVDSSGLLQEHLRPVLRLKASISQIKEVAAGETVGYGRRGRVDHPMRIGTIAIGYGDGFLRKAGNGRFSVHLHGQQAPTVGNICMDMSMIDLTHISQAREGDEVVIFGPEQRVQLLADSLETIPYEVFTNISERVKRLYFKD